MNLFGRSEILFFVLFVDNVHYFINRDMLRRCKWQLNEIFQIIFEHNVRYLKNSCNSNTYVVFDGYKKIVLHQVEEIVSCIEK